MWFLTINVRASVTDFVKERCRCLSVKEDIRFDLMPEGRGENALPYGWASDNLAFACAGCMAGAIGLFFRVFIAEAWVRIGGTATRNRFRPATLVAHLRSVFTNTVLVQQMTERTDRHFQKVRGVGLAA